MTELNQLHAEAAGDWPALDDPGRDGRVSQDPVVARTIEPIRGLPDLPLGQHPERFTAAHDALLAALHEELPAAAPAATGSSPRPDGR